jgi:hypothetical protein
MQAALDEETSEPADSTDSAGSDPLADILAGGYGELNREQQPDESGDPSDGESFSGVARRSRHRPGTPDAASASRQILLLRPMALTGTQPAGSPSAVPSFDNATRIPQAQQPNPVPRTMPGNAPNQPPGQVGRPMPPGLANRPVPNPFQVETPGQPAPPDHYNYEPGPDGSWRVYPPGLPAPGSRLSRRACPERLPRQTTAGCGLPSSTT